MQGQMYELLDTVVLCWVVLGCVTIEQVSLGLMGKVDSEDTLGSACTCYRPAASV